MKFIAPMISISSFAFAVILVFLNQSGFAVMAWTFCGTVWLERTLEMWADRKEPK